MAEWVLIVLLWRSPPHMQAFTSLERCEAAAASVREAIREHDAYMLSGLSTKCVER